MKINLKLFIIIIFTNFLKLKTHPISEYEELECSAQDHLALKRLKRAAKSLKKYPIWPNSIVPYYIDCPIFNEEELNLLRRSLDEIENNTCVQFVEMKDLGNYKNFIYVRCKPEDGCKSELGYQGRPQNLNLKAHREITGPGGCMTKRKIQHEFMHALGFQHEHNSPVRDQYVKIITTNINPGWEDYFRIDSPVDFDLYGCSYDYYSVMQVDTYRHSKSKTLPTIIPLDKKIPLDKFGRAKNISECDIERICNIYCKDDGNTRSKNKSKKEKKQVGVGKEVKKYVNLFNKFI